MSWIYLKSRSENLYTVGHYSPSGEWIPHRDFESVTDATDEINFLNGGSKKTTTPAVSFDREELDWLGILVASYKSEHNWKDDEDPSATDEMISSCEHLLKKLRGQQEPEEPPQHYTPSDDDSIPF